MFFKNKIIKKFRNKLKNIKIKQKETLKKERNKFISVLSHDIKTPILAQNQGLELLLNNNFDRLLPKQKEIIEEIYQSNNFLLEIVLNSIFLAKYENENPKLNLEKIDIIEQIKDCCELIKTQANEKRQNIVLKIDTKEKIKLEADRKLIQKIILNILSSSISSGFEDSDIEILIKENNNSFSFCAKNKSVFMTKQKLKSLFEEKTNTSDLNQLGMSLNLNIAGKLIEAHNWDLIADSVNGENSFGFCVEKI